MLPEKEATGAVPEQQRLCAVVPACSPPEALRWLSALVTLPAAGAHSSLFLGSMFPRCVLRKHFITDVM